LIELLVVIAIIAILIGLLVPAVQKVRAAAARTQCQNNLKQIGLGMHMYQDSYKKLPTGWVTSTAVQPNPGWSWSVLILPFVEQAPLYNSINPDVRTPGAAPAANAVLQTSLPIFLCPSDNTQPLNPNLGNYGMANYVVNREVTGPNAANLPAPMTVQGIRDGSSNTILVGERDIMTNIGAIWGVRGSTTAAFEGRPGAGISPQPAPGTTWNTGNNQRLAFSSQHTGGANFLFADGSVHFLSNSIDADPNDNWGTFPAPSIAFTFQNLIHPNDGMPINLADLQ
jgi:prepilin-type processing-associated H-X9-DG protein